MSRLRRTGRMDGGAEEGAPSTSAHSFLESIVNSPQVIANATVKVRRLMEETPSADEFAAGHGRRTLVWSYGIYAFEDAEVKQWAQRVAEILATPELLEGCEEQYLAGDDLEHARKCRVEREE